MITGQKQKVQLFGAGAKGWNWASAKGTARFMCLLVPKEGPPMVAIERRWAAAREVNGAARGQGQRQWLNFLQISI